MASLVDPSAPELLTKPQWPPSSGHNSSDVQLPMMHWLAGQLVQQVLAQACAQLATLQGFDEQPDLADDAFLLASSLLHQCPSLFAELPLLPTLLDCATTGILVQHRCACWPKLDQHCICLCA